MAAAIRAHEEGKDPDPAVLFPSVQDGVKGMAFVVAAVESSAAGGTWVPL